MKMEQSVPKRRHIKFRRRGNYSEESIQHSDQGESLKSIILSTPNTFRVVIGFIDTTVVYLRPLRPVSRRK